MMVYPLVYRYLAKTENEKQRVLKLISSIVKYIVSNDYYLIDADGKRTTWGVWNPIYLNKNPMWYDTLLS
jgi:hypothetical protein